MGNSLASPAALTSADAVEALGEARERTLGLVESVSDEDLERAFSPLMSPLVWDLGHIAAYEDLWLVHRFGGQPLLREELATIYDAFETPRAGRSQLDFLRPTAAREYLAEVRSRALAVIERCGVGDGVLHEMVVRHEQQHGETMLQAIGLARLEGYRLRLAGGPSAPTDPPATATDGALIGPLADHPPIDPAANGASATVATGLELVEIPAGSCTIGAGPGGFAYDNERPRHPTDVRGYLIGRTPITNATYLRFVEGGGYERREWWSDEGWAWKEQYDITRPLAWTEDRDAEWRLGSLQPFAPHRPVVHVSWFEADAFARAHGARLPSETEWEKAATWDQEAQRARSYPWGEQRPVPGLHANVDHWGGAPAAGSYPAGASPYGCLAMIGDVWEWIADDFTAYPGFVAYPYREYSEVFFGSSYKVLRGGSWATRARVATPTFRNWDYPQRRQIFSGIRIAKDLPS